MVATEVAAVRSLFFSKVIFFLKAVFNSSNSTQYLGYFLGMPLVFLTFVGLSKQKKICH